MSDTLSLILLIVYVSAAGILFLYGLNCYAMIFLCARKRKGAVQSDRALLEEFYRTHDDDDLPVVTTQLPIYNEANVVERLVESVCNFDYPPGKHEIQLLDDSTDHTREIAAEVVERLRLEGHDVQHLCRDDRSGYKAGALAEGLEVARGELVAVFDADFVPEPDFLRKTVPYLAADPEVGFVQTRWGHRNRGFSLLTRAQSIGIDGHFAVEQSARCWNGLFLNFNGTAGVWRVKAIRGAGGWKADTLTEDLDLSYRAQLAGWLPRYLFEVVAPAEVPTDINALKTQQHRWAKGSIQTAVKLLPTILRRKDVGLFKKLQAFLHLTHYGIHPVMVTMAVLVLPILFLGQKWMEPTLMVGLLAGILLTMMAPNVMYLFSQQIAHGSWRRAARTLPALMVLGVGLAVNNSRAVLEGLFGGGQTEFVRTPKLGDAAERAPSSGGAGRRAPRRWYHQPLGRLFLLEIALGLWSVAAFVKYLSLMKFIVGPLLLLNALGYTSVGVLSWLHERKARRRVA